VFHSNSFTVLSRISRATFPANFAINEDGNTSKTLVGSPARNSPFGDLSIDKDYITSLPYNGYRVFPGVKAAGAL
jgi:hypothetical protein